MDQLSHENLKARCIMSVAFSGQYCLTDARMSSADLVHRYGLGFSLWRAMKARMSASSCLIEVWTPRLSCLRVSSANHRSWRNS